MYEQNPNDQAAPAPELTDASLENVAGGCFYPILLPTDIVIDTIDVTNGPDVAF